MEEPRKQIIDRVFKEKGIDNPKYYPFELTQEEINYIWEKENNNGLL